MWTTIITVGLQLLGYFLGKNSENKELQKKFYEFVEAFDKEYMNSAKLKKSYEEQLKRLRSGQVVHPVNGETK